MSVAKSYAKALLEVAQDARISAGEIEKMEAQLDSLVGVVRTSRDARVALTSPATGTKDKIKLIEGFARRIEASPTLTNFLILLARKERLGLLGEIREAFGNLRLEAEGGIRGRLVSADPLPQAEVDGLSAAFGKKFGKRVAFSASTDPALLAGMKVTVNGVTYDGTLRSQLQRLRDRLVYGTSGTH